MSAALNDAHYTTFQEMKQFLDFGEADVARLAALGPVFATHGPRITDSFYESLLAYPKTASIVEGRVDALKATHKGWLSQLFAGDYGEAFFQSQYTIGQVHVVQNINPEFVEGVTSILRTYGQMAIFEEMGRDENAEQHANSYVKLLDLALLVINLAYAEERVERISGVTGMSRKLIENLIQRGGKKKK